MTRSWLLPTITTTTRSEQFSPLCSSGQEDILLNCSLCRHTGHTEWTLLTSMATHSSPLPTIEMEVNTTSTRWFTNRMATSLFCSSPFLLVEPSPGIPLWSAAKRSWVWLITMVTVNATILSQLCTRPLERSSSSTKRFQHTGQVTWQHLSTKVTPTWQWRTNTIRKTTSTAPCTNGRRDRYRRCRILKNDQDKELFCII